MILDRCVVLIAGFAGEKAHGSMRAQKEMRCGPLSDRIGQRNARS